MFLLLLAVWIIFNGQITWEILGFGIVIAALMYGFMCKFLDFSVKKDLMILRLLPGGLDYFLTLMVEIVKANIACIGYLFSIKKEIEPLMVTFRAPLETKAARVVLANSITLTPGTITVTMEGDLFQVYCLDKELAEGLSDGIFVQKLLKLEAKR